MRHCTGWSFMLAITILDTLYLISLWIMMWGFSPGEGNFHLMLFEVGWLDSLRFCLSTLCKGWDWCIKYVFSTSCASFCLNSSMKLQISFLGIMFLFFFYLCLLKQILQTFHGKRSHPLLWVCSRITGRKITIGGITYCLNYCLIFIIRKEFANVAADRSVKHGGPRVEYQCSKWNYLRACA